MMKKLLPFLCASALALSLTACAGTINNSTADTASNVTFTFTDSGVTAAGETDTGYEIDGTALTITSSGTYTVSGSCADGSIKVKKGTTGVTLVLDGLTLTSENTAAITCGKSSEVTILVSNGTENSLSDTEQNNDDNYPENENAENAVIKCKDGSTVTLCGDGELTITANGKNGIKSGATTDEDGEASLTIRDLTLNIDAPVNDAINAEQLLNVESGTLTIGAADGAIHCDLVLNIGADGTDGPTIDITNCCEGLEGAELNVCSGDITINASDDCLNAANSDLTDYDFTMTISGGTIDAYSSGGDGFDSNGELTITGGTVVVWTANTADNEPLDADGTITVSGGTVLTAGGSSGMGMNLEATQPCVIYGSTGFGGMPGSTQSSLIAADADFTIEDADGNAVYSGTARCGANFILFSSADVVADSAYTLKAGDSSTEGTAQSGTVSTGMGMGGGRQLTLEALEVLERSDIVFGASRMLADLAPWLHEKHQETYYQPEKILDWLEEHKTCQQAVVVCSGDTGFYSGSGSMMRELKARFGEVESSPYEVTVFPGISSVSALAARFGISWDDACLASAHGRDCDAAALLKEHEKVFLLLDSSMNLRQICQILKDADMGNTRIYAGVRMGYEDERKTYGTAEEMTDIETNSLTAVFLEREKDER